MSRMLRWFPGWVSVEAEGGYPERLLNGAAKLGIPIWRVRCRRETVRFACPAAAYRQLWPLSRRAYVRLRILQKHGLPFWAFRYRHRRGLLLGLMLYGALLALLAPRIWIIDVKGNSLTPSEEILEQAAASGVRLGAPAKGIQRKKLEINGLAALRHVSFIAVNLHGSAATIEVKEREDTPQVLDLSTPSDLVAARDGLILGTEAIGGQLLVKPGEAVRAGQVLMAGRVAGELEDKVYRSYGPVWARTRRRITVTVPLLYGVEEPTDRLIFRPELHLLGAVLPLYSPGSLPQPGQLREVRHFFTVGSRTLPLGVIHRYYRPTVEKTAARTAEQASAIAEKQLEEQEKALFLPDSYKRLNLSRELKKGEIWLSAEYSCRENIAVEIPLDGHSAKTDE